MKRIVVFAVTGLLFSCTVSESEKDSEQSKETVQQEIGNDTRWTNDWDKMELNGKVRVVCETTDSLESCTYFDKYGFVDSVVNTSKTVVKTVFEKDENHWPVKEMVYAGGKLVETKMYEYNDDYTESVITSDLKQERIVACTFDDMGMMIKKESETATRKVITETEYSDSYQTLTQVSEFISDDFNDKQTTRYKYDQEGNLTSITMDKPGVEDKTKVDSYFFNEYKKDDMGNWIQRKTSHTLFNRVTKREIIYY